MLLPFNLCGYLILICLLYVLVCVCARVCVLTRGRERDGMGWDGGTGEHAGRSARGRSGGTFLTYVRTY